jgi:3-oxoacyl-[acyl-carrier-protein] synthase II
MAVARPPKRRVAVTGLGVVSCCGIGADAFFEALSGPAPEGERRVQGFDGSAWFGAKELRRTDRFAQFSLAAAAMAIEDAGGLDAGAGGVRADRDRTGVIFGTGVGGLETLQAQFAVLFSKGPDRVSPFFVPMMMGNAGAAAISMRYGLRGPCETVVTACAAGTQSIGNAYRLIAYGICDAMVAGSSEAAMEPGGGAPPMGVVAFGQMTALSTSGFSRPFDVRRDGFVLAEGAGAVVL